MSLNAFICYNAGMPSKNVIRLKDNVYKRLQYATYMPQYCLSYNAPHLFTSTLLALRMGCCGGGGGGGMGLSKGLSANPAQIENCLINCQLICIPSAVDTPKF